MASGKSKPRIIKQAEKAATGGDANPAAKSPSVTALKGQIQDLNFRISYLYGEVRENRERAERAEALLEAAGEALAEKKRSVNLTREIPW